MNKQLAYLFKVQVTLTRLFEGANFESSRSGLTACITIAFFFFAIFDKLVRRKKLGKTAHRRIVLVSDEAAQQLVFLRN